MSQEHTSDSDDPKVVAAYVKAEAALSDYIQACGAMPYATYLYALRKILNEIHASTKTPAAGEG